MLGPTKKEGLDIVWAQFYRCICLYNCKWDGLLRPRVMTTTRKFGGGGREIAPQAGFYSDLHQTLKMFAL